MHFASYYANLINIDIDNDSDGLPDYYESNIPLYNGNRIVTSTYLQDTDGDTLKDGEEIIIYKEYIPIKNKVLVRAMMLSDPRNEDGDGDGMLDGKCKYKEDKKVLPADDKPLQKHPMANVLNAQYNSINENTLSYFYTEPPKCDLNATVDGIINNIKSIIAPYDGEIIPDREILVRDFIDAILSKRDSLKEIYPTLSLVLMSIKARAGEYWSDETAAFVSAEVSAYILNFCRANNNSTTFYARPNTWQKAYGYNVIYDDLFEAGTRMRVGKNYFQYDDNNDGTDELYIIWAWRGDYWNLGAGCEVGLYKFDHMAGSEMQFEATPQNVPMSLNLYNIQVNNNITTVQSIFHWYPTDPQWWITGFNYSYQSPNPYRLVTVGYIDLSMNENMYRNICNSCSLSYNQSLESDEKLFPYLIPDDQNRYIWFVWYN